MARIGTAGGNPVGRGWLRGGPVLRLLGVCAVALATANCANNPQRLAGASSGSDIDPKYGVRASRRLYNEGDEIPKGGGRRFSGKPYVVAGKTYVPREDGRGYVREGLASWYGSAFHGRMTANGEVFDRHSIAAAHPTLPLPSYARVTNLENGRSMVVRVNDRGPYHAGRVMDVSEEAARALEFHRRGTAHVRVEYVGKASVAGSDDRKLLATLRTDGRPASVGPNSPVMVADLGPDTAAPERFARSAAPLAFRPAEAADEEAPRARPARPAPVLVAGPASVAVPAAVQPTAARTAAFRPAPVAVAGLNPGAGRGAPLSLAPQPLRLAARSEPRAESRAAPHTDHRPERVAAAPAREAGPRHLRLAEAEPAPRGGRAERPAPSGQVGPPKVAAKAAAKAAMPGDARLAMARLAAASSGPAKAKPGERRARVAGAY